jgi:hypothetical protein
MLTKAEQRAIELLASRGVSRLIVKPDFYLRFVRFVGRRIVWSWLEDQPAEGFRLVWDDSMTDDEILGDRFGDRFGDRYSYRGLTVRLEKKYRRKPQK